MFPRRSIYNTTRNALLGAILYLVQIALASLPNVEMVSLLILLYSLIFGWEAMWMIAVFVLLEGITWGFGLWWLSYLYVWPLLCVMCILLHKWIKEEFVIWAVVSGFFGLIFGALFAIPYLLVDPAYALTYWISGLPWDLWHAACNFAVALVAGKPLYLMLRKVYRVTQRDEQNR